MIITYDCYDYDYNCQDYDDDDDDDNNCYYYISGFQLVLQPCQLSMDSEMVHQHPDHIL